MALRKLVAGNWKMHGVSSDLAEIAAIAEAARDYPSVDVALCVPAILIERAVRAVPGFAIGGAGRPPRRKGRPHRLHLGGDAARRRRDADHRRPSRAPRRPARKRRGRRAKAEAALACGLDVILCVGESLDVREAGEARRDRRGASSTRRFRELDDRPSWRSPTSRSGRSAPARSRSMEEIGAMHAALRGAAGRGLRRCGRSGSGSSTAARSRRRTRPKFSASATSTARWSAAPASRRRISCRSSRPRRCRLKARRAIA